jgi:hypothetical protein
VDPAALTMTTFRFVATLPIATALALAGCGSSAVDNRLASEPNGTVYHATEPISRKNHYPATSDTTERWEFCFGYQDGGWTCVPVSEADYNGYAVGQIITITQEPGRLAEIAR